MSEACRVSRLPALHTPAPQPTLVLQPSQGSTEGQTPQLLSGISSSHHCFFQPRNLIGRKGGKWGEICCLRTNPLSLQPAGPPSPFQSFPSGAASWFQANKAARAFPLEDPGILGLGIRFQGTPGMLALCSLCFFPPTPCPNQAQKCSSILHTLRG